MFKKNLTFFLVLWQFMRRFKVLRRFKDRLKILSRLLDVAMMMLFFHIWPEQTYRFSTRKLLPAKKNRFPKNLKPLVPYNLIKNKSSSISMMKEITIICTGKSFDLNKIKDIDGPIFLLAFSNPLREDSNGKIIYTHDWNSKTVEKKKFPKLFADLKKNKEYKNNNLTYVYNRKEAVELFMKNGNNVFSINTYSTDKDGNLLPHSYEWLKPSYRSLYDQNQCKLISMAEMIYRPPHPAHPNNFAPTKSTLPHVYGLLFFSEKINIYGWDYYLNSSPENMSKWQLIFNMYSYVDDTNQSNYHFEGALLNYYYAYQLSKLPNVKIHGYMGKLEKHHKLIKKIERVLFN